MHEGRINDTWAGFSFPPFLLCNARKKFFTQNGGSNAPLPSRKNRRLKWHSEKKAAHKFWTIWAKVRVFDCAVILLFSRALRARGFIPPLKSWKIKIELAKLSHFYAFHSCLPKEEEEPFFKCGSLFFEWARGWEGGRGKINHGVICFCI